VLSFKVRAQGACPPMALVRRAVRRCTPIHSAAITVRRNNLLSAIVNRGTAMTLPKLIAGQLTRNTQPLISKSHTVTSKFPPGNVLERLNTVVVHTELTVFR